MFKSCCVCMSEKVVESENRPHSAAEVGGDRGRKTRAGNGHTSAVGPARGDKVNGGDSCEKSLANSAPEVRVDSATDKAKETKSTEKSFDVCAEIKEELHKLQNLDECDASVILEPAMERDTLMTSIPEAGSSPSEQSSGKESILDSEDNVAGTFGGDSSDTRAGRPKESDSAVSFGTRESDDEESDPGGSSPPEGARRTSSGGILKRPSIAWPAEERPREVSDDDDVFCAPPASVLAARKQSLPAGLGGGAVGRDELALRRHRVFSELVGAARAAAEHRVRFDPLGPLVATGAENHVSSHVSPADLERLLDRLERVVNRLERVAGVPPPSPPPSSSPPPPVPPEDSTEESGTASPSSPSANSQIDSESQENSKMSVQGYQDIMQGPLAQYISLSKQIGGDVATHANLVQKAFQAQLQYLTLAAQSAAPSASQQQSLLAPTSQQIQAIQEFREKNRVSPLFNHLSAISESIPALGWVAVSPTPAPYVKEMNDAGQFYTNRVLKDWKEKDKKHVDWCKSWVQTLQELQAFVKQQHTTGLVWAGSGSCPPPPPCGMPPPPPCPPPVVDFGADLTGDERTALFAQINQGEDITKSLKKVTSDMQTHKNTTLREGPAPFRAPVVAPKPFAKALPIAGAGAIDKPPVFNRDGKKWLIEYQKGNQGLTVENAEMNNVVYMFKCRDSALTVKGKINSIVLDSCTKCAVVFDSLVSSVEFVNCQSVQMQVLGKVPTVSIDKTDGCQMYLSEDSLNVEVVSSKSSEMNVLVPKGNGDYTELPIPEQFKTTLNKASSSLTTVAIESKG